MRILCALLLSIFLHDATCASTPETHAEEPLKPGAAIPFDAWPLDMLIMRENELRAKVDVDEKSINRALSAAIDDLLRQAKVYYRTAAVLSYSSKIIGGAGPIALILATAFNAPTFANYIIGALTSVAVPMYHFSEQAKAAGTDLDKEAIRKHSDDIVEYQKIRLARKKKEAAEAVQAVQDQALNNEKVLRVLRTVYHYVTGSAKLDEGDEELDDMERGMLLAFSPPKEVPAADEKGKDDVVGYQSGKAPPPAKSPGTLKRRAKHKANMATAKPKPQTTAQMEAVNIPPSMPTESDNK